MVTQFEFNGDKFSLFDKWIFMVTFWDIYGDSNDLTQKIEKKRSGNVRQNKPKKSLIFNENFPYISQNYKR